VELEANQQSGFGTDHIELRLVDDEKRASRAPGELLTEMGASLSLEQAESLANWLLEAVSDFRNGIE
jgi:hypothetical protein